MRLPSLGLRARLVGALVLASAATLAVASVALLGPLEARLRNRELTALESTTLAARSSFARLPAAGERPGAGEAQRQVRLLARRTGGAVTLLNRQLVAIASTDPDAADLFDDAQRALTIHRSVRTIERVDETDRARVAVPVRIGRRAYVIAARRPISEVPDAVRVVRRAFAVAALVGLSIALVVGFGLASRLLRRLRRLRGAALRVADVGPGAEVPADDSRDEVGDLARAFATMQGRLRQQEEARRAFVATASHELRTPVASLQGMLELLDEDLRGNDPDLDDARLQVGRARVQARRLARLAADLLDLSRLDAEVPLRAEPVDLGELSRAVLAEFQPGSVPLELRAPGEPCWARADPGGVARILRILVENAVRVSPDGAPVTVTVRNGSQAASLTVSDHGPGVPEDEREAIFERFRRGSTPGGGGVGLGLAIGRGLAERMGGTLVLDDRPEGATFTVRLPAGAA